MIGKNTAPPRPPTQPRAGSAAWSAVGCLLIALSLSVFMSMGRVRAQSSDHATTRQALQLARAAKDSLFRSAEADSPIPDEARATFAGLSYFDLDPAFSFNGELHRYGRSRQVPLLTNTGTHMQFERFGRLFFRFNGNRFWLEIHRNLEVGDLSIFFNDATNGVQSYPGGRYVPLTALDDGMYLVDFNRSYNPYCSYNPNYICPLPPAQNHLPFAVLAGERSYGPNVAH